MVKDKNNEHQGYQFSDDFEPEEESDWYFDLPEGAWERQEEKNQTLRQRLLDQAGNHSRPLPTSQDIDEDGPERDDAAAAIEPAHPQGNRRWQFGRRRDEANVEPVPDIEDALDDAAPWTTSVGETEFVPPPRFEAEADDDPPRRTGEDGEYVPPPYFEAADDSFDDEDVQAPDFALPPRLEGADELRALDPSAADIVSLDDHREASAQAEEADLSEPVTASKWEDALEASAGSGSIIEGMRQWAQAAKKSEQEAEQERSASSSPNADCTADVEPIEPGAASDESNEDDEPDDQWVLELLEADEEVFGTDVNQPGLFAKLLGRRKTVEFDEGHTLELAEAAPDWAPDELVDESASVDDAGGAMSEKDPWAEFLEDGDSGSDQRGLAPQGPPVDDASSVPATVEGDSQAFEVGEELGPGAPLENAVEWGPVPVIEGDEDNTESILAGPADDETPVVEDASDETASSSEVALDSSIFEAHANDADDPEPWDDVFGADDAAAVSTPDDNDAGSLDLTDAVAADRSMLTVEDAGDEAASSFEVALDANVFEALTDDSNDPEPWGDVFGADDAPAVSAFDAEEVSQLDRYGTSPNDVDDETPMVEAFGGDLASTFEASSEHQIFEPRDDTGGSGPDDVWGDGPEFRDSSEQPGDGQETYEPEDAPAHDPWDVIAALGQDLERAGVSEEPGVILGRTGVGSRRVEPDDDSGYGPEPAKDTTEDHEEDEDRPEDSGWRLASGPKAGASDDDDVVLRAFNDHAAAADDAEDEAAETESEQREPINFHSILDADSEQMVHEPMDASSDDGRPRGLPAWAPQRSVDVVDEDYGSDYVDDEPMSFVHRDADGDNDDGPVPPWTTDGEGGSSADSASRAARTKTVVRELVETGLLALLVFLAVRASFQNFKVEGESMLPTLENGQYIIVNKLAYSEVDMDKLSGFVPFVSADEGEEQYVFTGPERGTIIVFNSPRDPSEDLIKRIIGLPGETIEIVNGQVYVNGFRLDEPYVNGEWTGTYSRVLIAPHQYFVMGDNRNNSQDSRSPAVGLVDKDLMIGKAMVSYWPKSQIGLAPNGGAVITNERVPLDSAKVAQ